MPYPANVYRIVVRGSLLDGAEEWNNVWSVIDEVGGQDVNELATIVHDLYADIFALDISSHSAALGATVEKLSDGTRTELSFASITGDDLADPFPPQIAARVSLTAAGNRHGGPYITGWSKNAGDDQGQLQEQGALALAVANYFDALNTAGWFPGIDSPTDEQVYPVLSAKVGKRFDVIRKRANEIPEAATPIAVP